MNAFSPERLARTATRHPWVVTGAWAIFLIGIFALGLTFGGKLSTDDSTYRKLDSVVAEDLIKARFGDELPLTEYVVIRNEAATVDDPSFRAVAEGVANGARGLGDSVSSVTSYYETNDATLVSADRHTLLMPVVLMAGDVQQAVDHADGLITVLQGFDGKDGFEVVTGGQASVAHTWIHTSEKDLQMAEVIGLPIALVVLVVVFGALVAAGMPILVGLFSIAGAIGATLLVAAAVDMSIFVTNMITMIGLAVGIDYSLLIIQRVREERRHGRERDDAIIRAGATAARSVLFSGMAVVVALSGMLLVPTSIYRSIAVGSVVVVLVAVAAALTLLPAVLRLLGDRVNAGTLRIPFRQARPKSETGRFWTAMTNFVMKHAVLSVVVSAGLLIAASLPYFTIELGSSGVSTLPDGSDPKRAFTLLDEQFNAGLLAPAVIVIDANDVSSGQVQGGLNQLKAALAGDPRFELAGYETNPTNTLGKLEIAIQGDSESEGARQAVRDLRERYVPQAFSGTDAKVYVGGSTASSMDFNTLIDDATPIVFAFVLGLSFIILLLVFRSIVVPLKAIVMNLLSVGAAYGLMVLVFQHGVGAGLLGFQTVERIEAWVPLFMFAVLFGLSMDYHVFLLSRIREHFDATHDNAASVAFGVRTTAGMITGAALIMVAVFSGFAMGDLVMFQQMGFGLAVAVFLDATIVRTVLVPASMELLGDRNWYMPSWLAWLPCIDLEGRAEHAPLLPRGAPAGGK